MKRKIKVKFVYEKKVCLIKLGFKCGGFWFSIDWLVMLINLINFKKGGWIREIWMNKSISKIKVNFEYYLE